MDRLSSKLNRLPCLNGPGEQISWLFGLLGLVKQFYPVTQMLDALAVLPNKRSLRLREYRAAVLKKVLTWTRMMGPPLSPF